MKWKHRPAWWSVCKAWALTSLTNFWRLPDTFDVSWTNSDVRRHNKFVFGNFCTPRDQFIRHYERRHWSTVSTAIVAMFERHFFIAVSLCFICMIPQVVFRKESREREVRMFITLMFEVMMKQRGQLENLNRKCISRDDLQTEKYGYGLFH